MKTKTRTTVEIVVKAIDKLTIFCGYISGIMAIVLCLLVFAAVILRYFFHSPISWSDEVSAYIYIYHCILALAYATYLESHVSAEIVSDKFSPRIKFVISLFGYIVMMICIGIIVYYGSKTTYMYYSREWRSATSHEMLLWPIMVVIPAGFFLFFLQCISRVYVAVMRVVLKDPTAMQPQR